jgi:6-phosphogluconolactonase
MIDEHLFTDRESLFAALCAALAARTRAALDARGVALLGLSGGSTPLPLYRRFALLDLDWTRVIFALVDERWVGLQHPASNEAALRAALAPALAKSARLQGMKTPAHHAIDGLADCESAYRALPLPFDVVLLGMGEDGHIASLFPHAEGLEAALDPQATALCAAISAKPSTVTGEHTERLSLTVHALDTAGELALLMLGDAKRHTLADAAAGHDALAMPVRALLRPHHPPLTLWWAPLENSP